MKQTGIVLLAAMLIITAIVLERARDGVGGDGGVVLPPTRTATVTRTAGWWVEVVTWTPTTTGEGSPAGETTRTVEATATPVLDIPPVQTVERPTPRPTWTRRP